MRRCSLSFVATIVLCLAAAAPLCAQQAGVLLGFGQPTGETKPEYKTIWIVFSPAEARVVATVPDLIVPRSTGFWRVGVTTACEYLPGAEQDASRDAVWQTPLDKAPVIPQGPPCKAHAPGDIRDSEEEAADSGSDSQRVRLCSRTTASILFVSPTHIAEEFNSSDTCDGRGGRDITSNDVRLLDSKEPIVLTDLFGAAATSAYSGAAKKGFIELSKDMNCPEPADDEYDLKSWRIMRVRGVWVPGASLDMNPGECAYFHPMTLRLPKSVTGEAAKPELWRAFAAAVPHLSDFFLSPLGDYALVLVAPKEFEYHLYAYTVQNGAPGRRLVEVPWERSYQIAMAQWSAGKYVDQWSTVIEKISSHPLLPAVFQPAAQ